MTPLQVILPQAHFVALSSHVLQIWTLAEVLRKQSLQSREMCGYDCGGAGLWLWSDAAVAVTAGPLLPRGGFQGTDILMFMHVH